MSKHSKALRDIIGIISSPVLRARMYEAADHMEKLEAQLRIARKMLRGAQELSWKPLPEPDLNAAIGRINHVANMCGSAPTAMRKAGRKK